MIKIGVVGKVSSGKSSVINSLAGGFISNVSLLRETLQPLNYQFSPDGSEDLIKELGDQLEGDRVDDDVCDRIEKMKEEEISSVKMKCDDIKVLPSRWGLGKMLIMDLPGIDDADDSSGKFFKVFESLHSRFDLVIYVTDAAQAFRDKSEVDTFGKIKRMIDVWNNTGEFTDLIILINKFDDEDDDDLEKIWEKILRNKYLKKDKIFRFSSHRIFMDCVVRHKKLVYLPNKQVEKEFRKILKNADYSKLVWNSDVNNDVEIIGCEIDADDEIIGDIDDLIPYLRGFLKIKENGIINSFERYSDLILLECYLLYGKRKAIIYVIPSFVEYEKVMSELCVRLWSRWDDNDSYSVWIRKKQVMDNLINDYCIRITQDDIMLGSKHVRRICLLENLIEYAICYKIKNCFEIIINVAQWITKHYSNFDESAHIILHQIICGGYFLPAEISHVELFNKVFSNEKIYAHEYKFSNNFWSWIDKKIHHNIELPQQCAILKDNNLDTYSWYVLHIIKGLHAFQHYDICYLLSLSKFTVPEMLVMHTSNDINYKFDSTFPTFRQNIEWIIATKPPIDRYTSWCKLLQSHWDDAHMLYLQKKQIHNREIQYFKVDYDESENSSEDESVISAQTNAPIIPKN